MLTPRISEALRVPMVTDLIGANLSIKDLKRCRLVCRDWSLNFLGPLRKYGFIALRDPEDVQRFIETHSASSTSNSQQNIYNQLVCQKQFIFWFTYCLDCALMEDFWSIHGNSMTYLQLCEVSLCYAENLLDILYRRTPKLKTLILKDWNFNSFSLLENALEGESVQQPNLTTLEVIGLGDSRAFGLTEEETRDRVSSQLKADVLAKIILLYPNLKNLRIDGFFGNNPSAYHYLNSALSKLVNIRKTDAKRFAIKHLHIISADTGVTNTPIRRPFMETFKALQFPLSTLTIDMGLYSNPRVISGILKGCMSTLTTLDLFHLPVQYYNDRTPNPDAPYRWRVTLNSLKVLRISGAVPTNILQRTPNLEVFHVCQTETRPGHWNHIPDQMDAIHSGVRNLHEHKEIDANIVHLEKLKEFRYDYKLTPEDVKDKLVAVMPNLEALILGATHDVELVDQVLQEILGGFGNLKELTIRIGLMDEEKILMLLTPLRRLKKVELVPYADLYMYMVRYGVSKNLPLPNFWKKHLRLELW